MSSIYNVFHSTSHFCNRFAKQIFKLAVAVAVACGDQSQRKKLAVRRTEAMVAMRGMRMVAIGVLMQCLVHRCTGFGNAAFVVPASVSLAMRWNGSKSPGLRGGGQAGKTPQMSIFGGLFGNKAPLEDETPGKFVRHSELMNTGGKAFGPLGVVVGGLGEDELEVLADRIEQVSYVSWSAMPVISALFPPRHDVMHACMQLDLCVFVL